MAVNHLDGCRRRLLAAARARRAIYWETQTKGAPVKTSVAIWIACTGLALAQQTPSKIPPENLENQRQAVKEERRLGVDNQPYGQSYEKMEELAYDNFAYQHTIIGSMADLDAASVEDVQQFFKTYYAPNNAVLSLAGDLDTKEALLKVKKYFGAIPRQEPPKPVDLTEPEKTAERRATLDDKLARLT